MKGEFDMEKGKFSTVITSKIFHDSEKQWAKMRKPCRKTTPKLCCWIGIFAVLFIILACPGLDPLDRKYESLRYAASFDRDYFDVCQGRRIFMYDLPSKFNVDVHLESRCNNSLIPWMDLCDRFTNGGYGMKLWDETKRRSQAVDEDGFDHTNWYDTDSYMLEMIYHNRLQKYRCLTNDTAKADAFYIPYYTGLLMLDYLYGTESEYEKRAKFGQELLDWMEANGGRSWRRFQGRDHFLMLGRTTWDATLHSNWGTGFSSMPYISNMTNMMLERRAIMENEQAVPYPTSFHPDSPERLQRWIEGVKSSRRKYLFSYVGAPREELSWSVRGIMGSSCINAGQSICNLVNCSIVKCSHDPITIYKSFLQANFCLQPRGDTTTRRSTFDCLISGAIPVFFHKDTAYRQYAWHLPEDPESYSVYIDEEEIKQGKSIQSVLMSYSPERIRRMRRTIISLIPNLVYNAYENEHSALPKDAFEVSMEKLLQRIARVKAEMGGSYKCWIPFISRNCFLSY